MKSDDKVAFFVVWVITFSPSSSKTKCDTIPISLLVGEETTRIPISQVD